jgi:signal transduction histidine kinase/CheY-like chemotaxis protein
MRNMRIQQRKLEALVTERTEDLEREVKERKQAQLDLQKANEIAEKARIAAEGANQAKSMFLARMSHEIRTPMNSVIGFSDMLIDTELSEEQTEYVRNITKSGEALLSLINEILDFSMIEAGRMTLQAIDFDLEITAFDICHLVQPRLENRPVEILCHIGDNVPAFIKGDAGRIRQMFLNLMANAAKFTHEGEIELFVDISEEHDKQIKLQGFVRDTGIGISQDKYDVIFEVFQQADGSTTRKYGGTGLGLAISRQIARLHKGDVWVESEIGKGSTFHFTAWVEKSDKKIEKKPPVDLLAGKRAVIVDDNMNNLDILKHILHLYQMTSIPLTRGDQLIKVLQEEFARGDAVHICILDIQMPEFSGYDIARLVRQQKDPRIASIPLLAFSSSTSKRTRMYRESGFDGFLPKPVQRQKLITMIKRLLGEKTESTEKSDKQMVITQHSLVEEAKHSVCILLAEDNPLNQKLAVFMLSKAGYHLDVAETGKEVVDRFTNNPLNYDLIFMDIHMPEMDGLEATRVLRERGYKDIPIIAMTADAMKEDREKCIGAGMNDYIAKPIKREVVFNMVRKWVLEKN